MTTQRPPILVLSVLAALCLACNGPGSGAPTDATGDYVLPPLPDVGGVGAPPVPAHCPPGGLDSAADLSAAPGTVKGGLDEHAQPLGGARVTVLWPGGCRETITAMDGTFMIEAPTTGPFAVSVEATGHQGVWSAHASRDDVTLDGLMPANLSVVLRPNFWGDFFAQVYGLSIDSSKGSVAVVFRLATSTVAGFGVDLSPASGVPYINTPDGQLVQGKMLLPGNSLHVVVFYNVDAGGVMALPIVPDGQSCVMALGGAWPVKPNVEVRTKIRCGPAAP